jgi:hypothetical protein
VIYAVHGVVHCPLGGRKSVFDTRRQEVGRRTSVERQRA